MNPSRSIGFLSNLSTAPATNTIELVGIDPGALGKVRRRYEISSHEN